MRISLTNDTSYEGELTVVDDLETERSGFYALVWLNPTNECYVRANHMHYRTIAHAKADGRRDYGVEARRLR